MVKTLTTINLDHEIKREAKGILHEEGYTLSFYLERCLKQLIESKKEEKKDGVVEKEGENI